MNIKWNKVTWYSKLIAAVLFIVILPTWTFFLGAQFQEVEGLLKQNQVHKEVTAHQQAWNTYSNSAYGFTLSHPDSMPIAEGMFHVSGTSYSIGRSVLLEVHPEQDTFSTLEAEVDRLVAERKEASAQSAASVSVTATKTTLGNVSGYLIKQQAADALMNTDETFIVDHGNFLYSFTYSYQANPQDKKAKQEYDTIQKIISSLTFTS